MTAQQILFNLPVTAARCQSLSNTDDQRCSNNAATYMRVGCVHEHVFVVLSCEPCAREAQRRNSHCGTCWNGEAGPPHSCALLGMPITPYALTPESPESEETTDA